MDPIIATSARSSISSSQWCLFHPSPRCLCFPAHPPFFFKESDVLIKYPLYSCEVPLLSFLPIFLSGDYHEDPIGASSYHSLFLFFSGGTKSSFVDHILSLFQYLLMPVHLIIFHRLLFYCFGVLKIPQKMLGFILILSRSFGNAILFKPFNSTGAFSLVNRSTVFSFEWALTHRSFPRILPDSSLFPGVILKSSKV